MKKYIYVLFSLLTLTLVGCKDSDNKDLPIVPAPEKPVAAGCYMIGADFGNWDWSSDEVVSMVPVVETAGQFWTVQYFKAKKGFKFCTVREWSGDFYERTTSYGKDDIWKVNDGNCEVNADGFYIVHIDLENDMMSIDNADIVFGTGPCFGGSWGETTHPYATKFTTTDGKTTPVLVNTTTVGGPLRGYVSSKLAREQSTAWWKMEFYLFAKEGGASGEYNIVYRGVDGQKEDDLEQTAAGQDVILNFKTGTAQVVPTGSISLDGDSPEPQVPTECYMIGDDFGNWDWESEDIVSLVPVVQVDGQFWTVQYIQAGKGFKFCPKKAWDGDFCELTTSYGKDEIWEIVSGNCQVKADGYYIIHVDLVNNIMTIDNADFVYGTGDCFGGDWGTTTHPYTAKTATINSVATPVFANTTMAEGKLRGYVSSKLAREQSTDWWKMEFYLFPKEGGASGEYDIVYRGVAGEKEKDLESTVTG